MEQKEYDTEFIRKCQRLNELHDVEELCERIGYGNVMDIASMAWSQHLESLGLPTEGAHKPAIVTDKHAYCEGKTYVSIDYTCKWMEKYMEHLGYIDEWCRRGEDGYIKAMEE